MLIRLDTDEEDDIRCDWCGQSISSSYWNLGGVTINGDSIDFCCLKCAHTFGCSFPEYKSLVNTLEPTDPTIE